MLLKAEDQEHLDQIELFTTWPKKYDIATGDWQYIHGIFSFCFHFENALSYFNH